MPHSEKTVFSYHLIFKHFCFLPQGFHLVEAHLCQGFTNLDAVCLDIVKPLNKLPVRHFQGIVWIQFVEPRCVDNSEKEITQFFCRSFFVVFAQLHLEFVQFLTHLLPDILTLLPVKTDVPGLILDPVGLDDTGQSRRNAR